MKKYNKTYFDLVWLDYFNKLKFIDSLNNKINNDILLQHIIKIRDVNNSKFM
jgi:hypothetical protein